MHVFNNNDSLSRSNNKIHEKKLLSKRCIKSVNHFLYWATCTIHMEIYLDAYGKPLQWQYTMGYTISTTPKAVEYTCADFSEQNRVHDVKQISWHGIWQSLEVSYFLCQLSIYLYMCNICTLLIENFLLNVSTISHGENDIENVWIQILQALSVS